MSIATEITRLQNAKTAIKSAIESKGVTVGDGLIDTYAEKINAIPSGSGSDYRTAVWNGIQNNGKRGNYQQAFAYWRESAWYPVHDMRVGDARSMFLNFNYYSDCEPISLPERCAECGITLDFSPCTYFTMAFQSAKISDIGTIDTTGATAVSSILNSNSHVTTAKLIVKKANTWGSAFNYASALKNLIVEGVWGKTVSFAWSPLSVESMKSIISALENYSNTSEEFTYTITFTEACWATLEADSNSPTGGLWKDYVMDLGWNV